MATGGLEAGGDPGATHPAEGLAVAADKDRHRGVDANLTPELRLEGLAREIVRGAVQDFASRAVWISLTASTL